MGERGRHNYPWPDRVEQLEAGLAGVRAERDRYREALERVIDRETFLYGRAADSTPSQTARIAREALDA